MLVASVQRSSFHDGPGLRTTVFLKGCSLRCPWCANPECINPRIQYVVDREICIGGGSTCAVRRDCAALHDDVPSGFPCPIGGITRFGNEIDERDLAKTLLIDKPYYGYDGGVTFSGGEPLLQGEGVSGTAKLLAEKNVSCSIETSLFAPTRALELVAQHMQCMYIDVKILDKELCTSILGGSIDLFLSNVDFIFSKKIKTIFRFPVAHGYTDTEQNLKALETLLCSYTPTKVEYFPVHNLAAPKYRLLGQQANVFSESSLELTAVQDLCLRAKVDCEMLRA